MNKAYKVMSFDVMSGDRFVCTLEYKYCPLFPVTVKELEDFVISKRPTLRGQKFKIEINN